MADEHAVLSDIEAAPTGGMATAPSTPERSNKRKRSAANSPSTTNEEAELARRRRRRQSLVFQKRRMSLTRGISGSAEDAPNRQYISDMYSTIIKMSSENKINIKNSWSLHLIDHMEDILSSSQAGVQDGEEEDDGTFNFQKASCTLDASVKIYSYRVDDTWTSSYKILENLSRSGNDKRGGEDDDEDGGDADGDGEDRRRKKKGSSRKTANATKSIEKNLNNITLKSYELEFEPDPLFHKMSQTFDEGGAKGMLLANLGVYDGAKILLNSADVQLSTRKLVEREEASPAEAESESHVTKTVDLTPLGNLACFTRDIMSLEICPPFKRLYNQVEELRGPDHTQQKVIMRSKVLQYEKKPLLRAGLKAPAPSTADENGSVEDYTEETDVGTADEADTADEQGDATGDDDDGDDNNDVDDGNDYDFQPAEMEVEDEDPSQTDLSQADLSQVDPSQADLSQADPSQADPEGANSALEESFIAPTGDEDDMFEEEEEDETIVNRHVDPVVNEEPTVPQIKSSADYFRSQRSDEVKKEEESAYSQLIETALMRSVEVGLDGNDQAQDDYSYFDVKVLKNWAGPTHWKFQTPRKISAKVLYGMDNDEEGEVAKPATKTRAKKQTVATEKKSLIIDFMSADTPDLTALLKAPRAESSIVLSKLVVGRQLQKSSDLVFPVDAHVEPKQFFRHFMKPRLQLFHRRRQSRPSVARFSLGGSLLPPSDDPAPFENGVDYENQDFDGGYSDDGGSDGEADQEDDLYSSHGLVTAERVVEKIDVHYERIAKRVDVKKLKTSIWTHLENDTGIVRSVPRGKKRGRKGGEEESEDSESEQVESTSAPSTTTFDSVVNSISDKVPSNVTVSFYFICMLHLANEKGLSLVGQDDLTNFEIKKEETTES
ncbi:hypothetical protein Poli38472_005446 [Pythium oligandrum]|uniref:Condensin complex subunit 2 n=1 Tax=Pythium oligandrum TaxID=41045 RepID=A0A8K1CI00_PYTOL|nr:hypothetical protein Poli38472_005446 [Pythium oligandrum]|eukprot:TMW62828.1 hypothetical protein Poli38472_005446 [Pythium oligandrum]